MNISFNELMNGKATRIKNKEYFPTSAYVEPFINRLSKLTNDFNISVVTPSQVTLDQDGNIITEDLTYNRVLIEAKLPDEYKFNDDPHKAVIGMVYGLDVRKPVVKFFKNMERCSCTNMCVFNPEYITCQDLEPETAINFKALDRLIELTDDTATTLKKIIETPFDCNNSNINESLGKWIRHCIAYSYDNHYGKVKVACSSPIDAYKLLFEKEDSEYYFDNRKEISMYQVYNSFTQVLTDGRKKDFFNVFEKTLLIKDILEL